MSITNLQKWMISFWSALLFLLIASPFMFRLTNSLTELVGLQTSSNGCPNIYGLLLHTVVFALLVRLSMV